MDLDQLINAIKNDVRSAVLQYKEEIIKEATYEILQAVKEELEKNKAGYSRYLQAVQNVESQLTVVRKDQEAKHSIVLNEITQFKAMIKEISSKIIELRTQIDKLAMIKMELDAVKLEVANNKEVIAELTQRMNALEKTQETLLTQVMMASTLSNNELNKTLNKVQELEGNVVLLSTKLENISKYYEYLMDRIEELNKNVISSAL